jgi:23S rRNA (adenine2030-N6)-methyltransferase
MLCLAHLKRKETPFRVIDTHAGAGRYRLDQTEATRTGEWHDGIARIFGPDAEPLPAQVRPLLAAYFAAVAAENADGRLQTYPGSPVLTQHALRAIDTLIANEMHPEEAELLRRSLGNDKGCKVLERDGYASLKALLPPVERRGLVLIDPPFEEPGELVRMTDALAEGLKRFATGIYLLWYPIKDEKPIARFHRGVSEVAEAAGIEPPMKVELLLRPPRNPDLLNGTGVVVVNAPFTLHGDLLALLPVLAKRLADNDKGSFRLGSVVAKPRAPSTPTHPPKKPGTVVRR